MNTNVLSFLTLVYLPSFMNSGVKFDLVCILVLRLFLFNLLLNYRNLYIQSVCFIHTDNSSSKCYYLIVLYGSNHKHLYKLIQ